MKLNKKRVFDIIQIGNKNDLPSRAFDWLIVTVILVNIAVLFLETFDELNAFDPVLKVLETATILIFCVEYLLRIWTAEFLYPGRSRGKAICRFLISFDGVVDLCTILPFFFLSGFVALRMLRVVRILHLFRINASYDSFHVITSVLYKKKNQIISSVFIILILILFSSLGMYSAEHEAQPEAFRNAFSGVWWSISTILTVGYGDIYPVTIVGRLMAIVISFLGVGMVAIPTGIISAGFVEQYTQMQHRQPPVARKGTVNILLEEDSPMVGQTVEEIELQHDIGILLLVRQGEVILPTGQLRTIPGDRLVYQAGHILTD